MENTVYSAEDIAWSYRITFVTFGVIIFVFYLGKKLAEKYKKKKVLREYMSEIDFAKEKEYFRDILKNYNPLELSFIDNLEIRNLERDIIAVVLNLKLKKKIDITEKGIVVKKRNFKDLTKVEIFIINSINENGTIEINDRTKLLNLLKEQVVKKKIVAKENEKKIMKKIKKHVDKEGIAFRIWLISSGLFLYVGPIIADYIDYDVPLGETDVIAQIVVPFLVIAPFVFFYISASVDIEPIIKEYSYYRTSKGEEINKKLEGLKNYIKDYSKLDEAEAKSLILWEEYLIYSVIFDFNDNIVDELKKFVDILKS